MRDVESKIKKDSDNIEHLEQRDNRLFIKVTESEKRDIEGKAKKYGYRYVSDYVRDACINEKIYIREYENKKEILDQVGNLIHEVQLLRRDHRYNFRMEEVKSDDMKLKYAIEDLQEVIRIKLLSKSVKIK